MVAIDREDRPVALRSSFDVTFGLSTARAGRSLRGAAGLISTASIDACSAFASRLRPVREWRRRIRRSVIFTPASRGARYTVRAIVVAKPSATARR